MVVVVVVAASGEGLPRHLVVVVGEERGVHAAQHWHWQSLPQNPNHNSWFCIGSLSFLDSFPKLY